MKGLRSDVTAIRDMLSDSADSQKGDRRYAWGIALSVAALVGAPLSVFFGVYIGSQITPLERDMAAIQSSMKSVAEVTSDHSKALANVVAQNASSISERQALLRTQESNVERLGKIEKDHEATTATFNARHAESETQISGLENNTALLAWHQEIVNHILSQNKGITYPLIPVPEVRISNRRPLPGGGGK